MALVELGTEIDAPVDRVFDLARDVDLHRASMGRYGEEAVGGVTSGLVGLGEEVMLQARHFGRRWTLTSRVTAFEPPWFFRDSLVRGPFARFDHEHRFVETGERRTLMIDRFEYTPPLGVLGRLADHLFLERYMRRVLGERQQAIKGAAESVAGGRVPSQTPTPPRG